MRAPRERLPCRETVETRGSAKVLPAARSLSRRTNRQPNAPNARPGLFGSVYDFYIERQWLSSIIGRLVWGIDVMVDFKALDAWRSGRPTNLVVASAPRAGMGLEVKPRGNP
jgi:hypothetical protein